MKIKRYFIVKPLSKSKKDKKMAKNTELLVNHMYHKKIEGDVRRMLFGYFGYKNKRVLVDKGD